MATECPTQKVEWHDVQGPRAFAATANTPFSANLLLEIKDGADAEVRKWLHSVSHRVTTSSVRKNEIDQCYINLAFSRSGLKKLGLTEECLSVFPTSFLEGMGVREPVTYFGR